MFGQTGLREALGARAKREKLGAARGRIVQREAGQHGVLSRLWGTGQPGVLRKRERDEIVDRGGHGAGAGGVGLRHPGFCIMMVHPRFCGAARGGGFPSGRVR